MGPLPREPKLMGPQPRDISFYESLGKVLSQYLFIYAIKINLLIIFYLGKIFAILGANGSGKSTLLRLIAGRFKPKIGRIKVFGRELGPLHPDVPGPGIGFVPHESGLFPALTVNETLVYYGMIYHMSDIERERRIGELSKIWSLDERDVRVGDLLSDQLKVVSIACAMIHNPKLLVLDEPTVGIDEVLKYKIWDVLERHNRKHGKC